MQRANQLHIDVVGPGCYRSLEPRALNQTKSAESTPPHRPNEQGCSEMSTHRAKTHKMEANPHTHRQRAMQTSTLCLFVNIHSKHNHTYEYNYNCCCYSGSRRLCGGMLLKPSGAVRKTLMPKGSDADRKQTVW